MSQGLQGRAHAAQEAAGRADRPAFSSAPPAPFRLAPPLAPSLPAPRSWVAGTEAEALLELDYPARSVFSPKYSTTSSPVPSSVNRLIASWYSKLAKPAAAAQFALVPGGAAGDPASLGVAWLMAAASAGAAKGNYKNIASREVAYLTKTVPKTKAGAISHRPPGEAAQLWSVGKLQGRAFATRAALRRHR